MIEHGTQHDAVVEPFSGSGGCRLRMARVVGVDAPDRLENLLERRECKQPFAGRQDIAEAGVLGDDRTAAREVAGAPVAEPAAAQPHVLVLGYRELAA